MNARFGRWDGPAYRAAGFILIFLILGAICYVFIKTLVFDSPINDRALQQSLIAAGVGVTISCLMVWLLDVLRIISLRPGWSKLLWGVLIASVLANSALAYKRWSTRGATVSIACLKPLETDQNGKPITPFKLREHSRYKQGEAVAYFAALRGIQENEDGDYSVELLAALENGQIGKARFARQQWSANKERLLVSEERKGRMKWYKEIAPECISDETIVFMPVMRGATVSEMGFGTHDYRVTVFDLSTGAYASGRAPLTMVAVAP